MKKLLVAFSLAFALLSFQAEAATLSLLNLVSAATDSGSIVVDSQKVAGSFNAGWVLGSDVDTKSHIIITANPAFSFGVDVLIGATTVLSFAADSLDKVFNLAFSSTDVVAFLISGDTFPFKKGNIDISVQAVPVPAAVWLFGSALMGLVGISRRKSA